MKLVQAGKEAECLPSVPLSSRGLQKYTQRASTYKRALTLSSAFTTRSVSDQKPSWKTSSVSGETRFCSASTFRLGLIALAASVAQVDLALQVQYNGRSVFRIAVSCRAYGARPVMNCTCRCPCLGRGTVCSGCSSRSHHHQ